MYSFTGLKNKGQQNQKNDKKILAASTKDPFFSRTISCFELEICRRFGTYFLKPVKIGQL